MVSNFAWKYESWKFTFWRNESWHFCHHMIRRVGAWGKNIKHCQVFYKIVRLAVSVLSQFRLQGWPILSTVPYWIWIALWILTTIFHFKYSSIKVTFVTELQSKPFHHHPGLDFFPEQVNCTTPPNFVFQRHPLGCTGGLAQCREHLPSFFHSLPTWQDSYRSPDIPRF